MSHIHDSPVRRALPGLPLYKTEQDIASDFKTRDQYESMPLVFLTNYRIFGEDGIHLNHLWSLFEIKLRKLYCLATVVLPPDVARSCSEDVYNNRRMYEVLIGPLINWSVEYMPDNGFIVGNWLQTERAWYRIDHNPCRDYQVMMATCIFATSIIHIADAGVPKETAEEMLIKEANHTMLSMAQSNSSTIGRCNPLDIKLFRVLSSDVLYVVSLLNKSYTNYAFYRKIRSECHAREVYVKTKRIVELSHSTAARWSMVETERRDTYMWGIVDLSLRYIDAEDENPSEHRMLNTFYGKYKLPDEIFFESRAHMSFVQWNSCTLSLRGERQAISDKIDTFCGEMKEFVMSKNKKQAVLAKAVSDKRPVVIALCDGPDAHADAHADDDDDVTAHVRCPPLEDCCDYVESPCDISYELTKPTRIDVPPPSRASPDDFDVMTLISTRDFILNEYKRNRDPEDSMEIENEHHIFARQQTRRRRMAEEVESHYNDNNGGDVYSTLYMKSIYSAAGRAARISSIAPDGVGANIYSRLHALGDMIDTDRIAESYGESGNPVASRGIVLERRPNTGPDGHIGSACLMRPNDLRFFPKSTSPEIEVILDVGPRVLSTGDPVNALLSGGVDFTLPDAADVVVKNSTSLL